MRLRKCCLGKADKGPKGGMTKVVLRKEVAMLVLHI